MRNTSPIISLFKEQLENECQKISVEKSLEKRGDHLSWWYFRRLVGLEDLRIEEVLCDGPNDLGIDAIYIDDDNLVHFYQFKNPESIESGFPAGDVDKVLAGLNLILSRKHDAIANVELRGRIEEIYQTVPTGYRLHLVTSGKGLSTESISKLDNFVAQLQGQEGFFTWEIRILVVCKISSIRRTSQVLKHQSISLLNNNPIQFDLLTMTAGCSM